MHHLTFIQRVGQQWGNLAYRKSFIIFSSSAGLRLCPLTFQTCETSIFFWSPELFRFGEYTQSKTQQTHMLNLIDLYVSPGFCHYFIHQSHGSAVDNHKLNGIPVFSLSLSSYFSSYSFLFSLCKDSPFKFPSAFYSPNILFLTPFSNKAVFPKLQSKCLNRCLMPESHRLPILNPNIGIFLKLNTSKTPRYFRIFLINFLLISVF